MPVRTLALWVSMGGSGPFQWLPDLKRWFKSEEGRKLAEKKDIFFTVSRPTRPPGKYKVIWDGKDNHGKQLGGGDYTILSRPPANTEPIKASARQISLSDKPFTRGLEGQCRDPIRLDRVSSQGCGKIALRSCHPRLTPTRHDAS